jgi:hypothetical protein
LSQVRICDVDGTPINAQADEYFVVTSGRGGRTKDICVRCARSLAGVVEWEPNTDYTVGMRVTPTDGEGVYVITIGGTSDDTEPIWPDPNSVGAFVDGTVTYASIPTPNGRVALHSKMPGQPEVWLSLWGWLNDVDEQNDVTA